MSYEDTIEYLCNVDTNFLNPDLWCKQKFSFRPFTYNMSGFMYFSDITLIFTLHTKIYSNVILLGKGSHEIIKIVFCLTCCTQSKS